VISAGLETDNVPGTLRVIVRELRRLIETPPGAADCAAPAITLSAKWS